MLIRNTTQDTGSDLEYNVVELICKQTNIVCWEGNIKSKRPGLSVTATRAGMGGNTGCRKTSNKYETKSSYKLNLTGEMG